MPIVPSNPPTAAETPSLHDERRALPPVRHRVRQVSPAAPQAAADETGAKRASDYEVGYGRPPAHTRFRPGKSGNPKGRPKAAKGLKTLARDVLTTSVPVRTASGEKKMHRIEAVLHKTVELAMKGNPRALTEILKLYSSAVPETTTAETAAVPPEELTAGDLAILEELKATLLQEASQ